MALSVPTPWVHGPNVEAALSSGASAGAAATRTSQEGLFESQRLGLESKRMQQAVQMQQAQLQQAAEQHQMEFQAKSKLAEQDRLRSDQRLQIENAYKTSQLGMAKGRLEQTQQAAEQKAQQASDMFRQEAGFHQYLQEHPGDYAGAWRSFPRVTSQVVNAAERSQRPPKAYTDFNTKDGIVRTYPDGTSKMIHEVKKKADNSADMLGAANPTATISPTSGSMWGGAGLIPNRLNGAPGPPQSSPTDVAPTPRDKLVRAHALGIANPDWTKEQIIDAVNKEMP